MTSEDRNDHLYFFDQPTQQHRVKRARRNFHLGAKSKHTTQSNRENDNTGDGLALSGETPGDVQPDTCALNTMDTEPLASYKRAAPQLLNEVAQLLSQHKWTKVGRIPHGIVNILNYSWKDRTLGSLPVKSSEWTDGCSGKLDEEEGASRQVSAKDKREAGERHSRGVGEVSPSVRKPHVGSNTKKRKLPSRAQKSPTVRFSINSDIGSNRGWIFQPKRPSCDEPHQISLCQWVLARLKAARSPEKLQSATKDLGKSLLLRHYGDPRIKLKDRRVRTDQPATLVNGMPRIPEVKQQDPERRKLHYRLEDGSSFIYYPSGCIAVCHSHSGLPSGGFYTNIFSDSKCPAVLATVTASGHGAVTHPHSSAIRAVWDQAGGFICDHHGKIKEGWSWQTERSQREKIIQLSDVISVKLLSGTSAVISFRCNKESVQLPLLAVPNITQSQEMVCLQTETTFSSACAHDLLLVRKTAHPAVFRGSKMNLFHTPSEGSSTCSSVQDLLLTDPLDVIRVSKTGLFPTPSEGTGSSDSAILRSKMNLIPTTMVKEVEGVKESLAQWRKRGYVSRELQRLQRRVRNILDGWMNYYHVAIGIKCPAVERMSDAPRRTRLRREVPAAALPSLNPPERADAKPVQVEEDRLLEIHSYLSASEETPVASLTSLPRTPKKPTKEESLVTRIRPIRIQGNFPLESVIIPGSKDLQPSAVTRSPSPPSFAPSFPPSVPLTVCPALLRDALLGKGGRRRCCCSAALMPVVTDLEYDAFVEGQPPHSQQILVVCTTLLLRHVTAPVLSSKLDVLGQLYMRMNKHRTMPCTQCQMDSFRLVKYEMSTKRPSCDGENNVLLHQRHRAAPGMALMYIRGKLLFVGHIFSGDSCSVRDLQKQISQTRADYRSGLSLSSDYKISDTVNTSAATDAHVSQDAALNAALTAAVEKGKGQ